MGMPYRRPAASWVLEGVVTTQSPAGVVNVAPMGPIVQPDFARLTLRPFPGSTTFTNLAALPRGVFHVTDDVLLLARGAIGRVTDAPTTAIADFPIPRLTDCCRWWAFAVTQVDQSEQRATLHCQVVEQGEVRPFLGFNRAKHAVLEAAILATRLHLTGAAAVLAEYEHLQTLVDKTGSAHEQVAFMELRQYVTRAQTSAALEPTR